MFTCMKLATACRAVGPPGRVPPAAPDYERTNAPRSRALEPDLDASLFDNSSDHLIPAATRQVDLDHVGTMQMQ